jgi:hypothetical protein
MKYTFCFILFLILFSSCQRTEVDYRMISYESKAWVDTVDFPTIKMCSDNTFRIYKKGQLITKGEFTERKDSLKFVVDGNGSNTTLRGCFADRLKAMIRLYNLTGIGVEAKYGYFQRVEKL